MKIRVLICLAALLVPILPLLAKTVDDALNEASSYLREGDYDQAIVKYKEAIEIDPKSPLLYNLVGMAYRFQYGLTRSKAYLAEAVAAFLKAIEIEPDYWVSMFHLGTVYHDMGEKKKAASILKKALELCPDHPERPLFEKMIREDESPKDPRELAGSSSPARPV